MKKNIAATLIKVPDAYAAFATLLTKYQELKAQQLKGIEQLEISAILKTEYFDERYFYSEGIQEVDYSVWDYADTEIIFTGKNYFEYFTSFIDALGNKIILHLKNKSIKHITKCFGGKKGFQTFWQEKTDILIINFQKEHFRKKI